ncbi:MAG: four helix bundle protein, partial [Bacteroidales bacterium]|nr:four helix bundle protein [Bacteroidales bacterium]
IMEYDPKPPSFFRFEDLRVYHKALDYAAWVQVATASMPATSGRSKEMFQQAAVNIAVQIAEGSARSKNQFIYYLKVAKSSVRECLVHTSTLSMLNLLDESQEGESRNELMELTKMIGALIGSLMRSSSGYVGEDDDDFPGPPDDRFNR